MVIFDATKEDIASVGKIIIRATSLGFLSSKRQREDLQMDLLATHANGCPLDFEKLLRADDFNFSHDIHGIQRHLSRSTGKLGGCFLPRCAKPNEASA
jgi:hypothetical protein